MKRMTRTLAITTGVVLAGVAAAPAAYADVTNPADNPYPITVTGDDGLTYTDGQDTLPGYDDYACTYIPGAWFDFANNRVRYPDGQSIPWTEWDRASGYKDWQAKQAAAAPAPAPAAPAPASTGGSSKPGGSSGASGASSDNPVYAADGSPSPSASPDASASASARPSASELSAETEPSPSAEAVIAADDAGSGGASTSSAGLAILAALFGLGGAAFGASTFFRKGARGTVTPSNP